MTLNTKPWLIIEIHRDGAERRLSRIAKQVGTAFRNADVEAEVRRQITEAGYVPAPEGFDARRRSAELQLRVSYFRADAFGAEPPERLLGVIRARFPEPGEVFARLSGLLSAADGHVKRKRRTRNPGTRYGRKDGRPRRRAWYEFVLAVGIGSALLNASAAPAWASVGHHAHASASPAYRVAPLRVNLRAGGQR